MEGIKFPKTKAKDYLSCREMIIVNYFSLNKAGLSEKEIKETINFVYDRFYASKIHNEDFYSFENLNGLENFLEKSKYFSREIIKECINHEKEHLEKIEEFNFPVKGFYVWLLEEKKKLTFAAGILVNKEVVSLDKLREIALAPKNLSLTDRLFI